MSHQKSIAIIICYFGKFPWYFQYFLHSCKYNPSIDIIIITDNYDYFEVPGNVRIIKNTFNNIKKLINNKLSIRLNFDNPYKLCDFKPAYGVIFSELIKNYDFWGHGDIDVIFGNIRRFITTKILNKYDVISVRDDYITGWFTLFKNCKKVNTLFEKSKDYKMVFSNPVYYNFDETNFAFGRFMDNVPLDQIKCEIESMTYLLKKLNAMKFVKVYFDLHAVEGIPGEMKWESGVLTYKKCYEILLYHMIELKKWYAPDKVPKKIPDIFSITSSKILF